MIAALPWYPAARPVLERLWRAARAHLGFGPESLSWPADCARHWQRPDILLTQTCAPVWRRHLVGRLHVVGALDFGVAAPGLYRSALVARLDDPRPVAALARAAVNDWESQSGWGALGGLPLRAAFATGSHEASMRAVAAGEADVAAIDAVSWRLAPHPRLAVRAWTAPTPAPPLLTGDPALVAPLRAALRAALADLAASDRRRTGLRGLAEVDAAFTAASPPLPAPFGCKSAADAA
ncbi:PhnD/SsuA/transferrin family substrate-binding protein [Jannaschia sp. W003]|uniref:PhnD/SsuA/transferrin family substrate-binding protein n=1 Tax=Jannaschia sp. W003 TaxID=2867012 RepID=UPI0021A7A001|nr:PhnD/SsuA/transferrin family substrate-binding protein [Jannaschia sp. W003]UWQ22763.1 PhnD/SsuA/transferrin family substrate-binding protein [Jannaschia sp. W003]